MKTGGLYNMEMKQTPVIFEIRSRRRRRKSKISRFYPFLVFR